MTLSIVSLSPQAHAEDEGYDPVWWRPVAGGDDAASGVVQGPGPDRGDLRSGVETIHARNILVARNRDADPARALITERTTLWLLAALRVVEPLELMVDQPLYLTQSYNRAELFDALESPGSFGVGDTRVGGNLRFARADRGWLRAAGVSGFLFVPLGRDRAFQGEPFRWEPRIWLETAPAANTRATLNVGWLFRERQTIPGFEVNDAAGWGVLLSHSLSTLFSLVVEANGQVIVGVEDFRAAHVPLEVRGSAALQLGRTVMTAGIGVGVLRGVGSSAISGNFQVRTDVDAIRRDRDGDGLLDEDDACPDDPEDIDLFDDHDGCPEDDNDRDTIPDARDSCPNDPEDFDDFEDVEGCPDPDNDADGVLDPVDNCVLTPNPGQSDIDADGRGDECDDDMDADGILNEPDNCPRVPNPDQLDIDGNGVGDACSDDRDGDGIANRVDDCPDDPEDLDGFADEDGCPEPDNDQDGILDRHDDCPVDPEDPDLFEDHDGCPDEDNDGDGILDRLDACPDEPEDPDGDRDDDGCPDNEVWIEDDQIVISEQVRFEFNSARITGERSFRMLDGVAEILLANPEISVRVEGHTDAQGGTEYNLELSRERAQSVVSYLVDQGVARGRLQAVGLGEGDPLQDNSTDEGRAVNRRVEFHIVDR